MTTFMSISDKLNQSLGPEWVCTRPGPGGAKLHYIEGKSAINLANDFFGYDGWSSEIKESVVDYLDVNDEGRVSVGISTTVRITLKSSSTVHEDIGYGTAENMTGKGAAFEKARKESATDGLKRALRMLGNAMGNCLYDKTYQRNINNMARPQASFAPKDLYRQEHVRKSLRESESATDTTAPPSVARPVKDHNISLHNHHQPASDTPSASSTRPVKELVVSLQATDTPATSSAAKELVVSLQNHPQSDISASSPHAFPTSWARAKKGRMAPQSCPQQTRRPSIPKKPARTSATTVFPTLASHHPSSDQRSEGVTRDLLTIEQESLLVTAKPARSVIVASQDSFGLDPEDEAFYAQIIDSDVEPPSPRKRQRP